MHIKPAPSALSLRAPYRSPAPARPVATAALLLAATAGSACAQSLVDPSFELNALENYATVLNDFVGEQGKWGVENASITGTVGGITPPDGSKMLGLSDDSLVVTQAWQVTDVSFNPFIPLGTASFSLGALFNAEHVPAAQASVVMQFFNGPGLGFEIPGSQLSTSFTLDNDPLTWQGISLSGAIPAATTWMVSQVSFTNGTMQGYAGYVDIASFGIIPTPASLALLGAAGLVAARRRR